MKKHEKDTPGSVEEIAAETPEETRRRTTGPGTHAAGSTVWLVWDPQNQLVHGSFPSKEDAEVRVRKLAGQAGDHGTLHIVEAPAQ